MTSAPNPTPKATTRSSHPLRWFPEFLELGKRRLRSQARLLGLSLAVGVIAGLGAIVFYMACQAVMHLSLDAIAGYRPSEPKGEMRLFEETATAFRPWLLLIVPTIGGLLSGWLVFTFAPEAEERYASAGACLRIQRAALMRSLA